MGLVKIRHPIENAQCGWVPIYGLFIGGNGSAGALISSSGAGVFGAVDFASRSDCAFMIPE